MTTQFKIVLHSINKIAGNNSKCIFQINNIKLDSSKQYRIALESFVSTSNSNILFSVDNLATTNCYNTNTYNNTIIAMLNSRLSNVISDKSMGINISSGIANELNVSLYDENFASINSMPPWSAILIIYEV